ncbi:alpha/beta hydrolase [Bacillus salacetis]|uniref:Alpha/beta hydrolase n=1 Tax=Bacillus salacetis TaxID=2315464 RepID=A0A3A1QYA7_9BACI|nr:alpha/beta hydrolase [Bacillus salacetis]RIW33590.1 alpha/beta hydrolase [Bacillus salacetis]
MKKWMPAVGGALAAAAGLGVFLTNQFMYLKKKDEQVILQREISAGRLNLEEYKALPKEEVSIPSPFGYSIKAVFIHPNPGNKYMIFCHGVTENKLNSLKYMNLFLKRGFNAVIYDHRRHGESGGSTSSYGFFEKQDLKAVVDELIKRQGEDVYFGIHGESMGAATTLLYAGSIEDRADFYIADCPYSDFGEQLSYRMAREVRLPVGRLLLPLADLFLKLREGYTLKDISPRSVVENIHKPVLFIHSIPDDYILSSMTQELYDKKSGSKKLYLAANGLHAQSYNDNKEEYEKAVDEFLEEIAAADQVS